MPDDFSGFIVLDGDDSEAEIDDADDKLVSLYNNVDYYLLTKQCFTVADTDKFLGARG